MAHRGIITKQRVVPAEDLGSNHAQEGTYFSKADTIEAGGRRYLILRTERNGGPFHLRLASVSEEYGTASMYHYANHGAVYKARGCRGRNVRVG